MDLEQLGLQLGVAGLIIIAGYKLAIVFIERWGKVQDARTAEEVRRTDAFTAGFKSLTEAITAGLGGLSERVGRVELKLDEVRRAVDPDTKD